MSDSPGPWFKMFAREWLEATRTLPLEVRGAYLDVLALIYERDGPVPDDDAWIAHHLHISTRRWRPIRAQLVAESKLFEVDGGLHNRRAQIEIERRANRRRINAENAANRGRTGREIGGNSKTINGKAQRFGCVSPIESESDQDEDDFYSMSHTTPRGGGLSDTELNSILEFLILAMPGKREKDHGIWLRSQIERYGGRIVFEAWKRCQGPISKGDVKTAAVHRYIEKAADELELAQPRGRA
jgi:uncharacterized protein YdaU (DUF1376 family)